MYFQGETRMTDFVQVQCRAGIVAIVIVVFAGIAQGIPFHEPLVCEELELFKVGCYADNQGDPRPLSVMLFTDENKTHPLYSGEPYYPEEDDYKSDLICRCASGALSRGYSVIGLQHYGECWSDEDDDSSYARDGPSKHCITWGGAPCEDGMDCIGEDNTNFVYKTRKDAPEPTTTASPTATPSPTPLKVSQPTARPTASRTARPTAARTARPTAARTARPTAARTPRPTASRTPRPTVLRTPRPTARATPPASPWPTPPATTPPKGTTTPKNSIASSSPLGSATSTAKPSEIPPISSSPCTLTPGYSYNSCMPPLQPCVPPACPLVATWPPASVNVPGQYNSIAPAVPYQPQQVYPAFNGRCYQYGCPASCAPYCSFACCRSHLSKKKRTQEERKQVLPDLKHA